MALLARKGIRHHESCHGFRLKAEEVRTEELAHGPFPRWISHLQLDVLVGSRLCRVSAAEAAPHPFRRLAHGSSMSDCVSERRISGRAGAAA